jgi:hypothetical protein
MILGGEMATNLENLNGEIYNSRKDMALFFGGLLAGSVVDVAISLQDPGLGAATTLALAGVVIKFLPPMIERHDELVEARSELEQS